MEENNNYSSISPFIAFIGVLLILPLGAFFGIAGVFELIKTNIIIEKIYYAILIYILGIIPLEASISLLRLIFISKGKRIILKDCPRFSYFVKYYFSLLPVFIIFMVLSSLFIVSFLRDFIRGNIQNNFRNQIWFSLLIILFWNLFKFGFISVVTFTKMFIKKLRENKDNHSTLNK